MQVSKRAYILIGVLVCIVAAGAYSTRWLATEVQPEPVFEAQAEYAPTRIGLSVEGRPIESYTFGTGSTHVLFVGGMHGGYEWNSVLLAYTFIDYLEAYPETVPNNLTVSVIPVLNPDGLAAIVGTTTRFTREEIQPASYSGEGRFNAHDVDLNRNFDCKWEPESMWRGQTVSAGSHAFSEPEAVALRDFILAKDVSAAVFWHSQSNAVYASECEDGILPETLDILNVYADAAAYPAVDSFDAYTITGDAEGWLASIGIPAITVELASHESIEWERNLQGVRALLEHFAE